MSQLLMFLFLALIVVFITTSAAVSTLVVAVLATKRAFAPTTGDVVFWGVLQGAVATAVLALGGGQSLRDVAVLTGGPFALVSVVALAGLTWTLRRDEADRDRVRRSLPGKARAALAARDVTLLPERPDLDDEKRE
jgi:choline-glycine betaine transporter